jgi:hypothetical protein
VTEKLRWVRAGVAIAGITVVLAVLVVVSNRAGGRKYVAQPRPSTMVTAIKLPGASFHAPVPLGASVELNGEPGYQARLQAVRRSGTSTLSYTIHVQNLGTYGFDGTLKTGVWLATGDGKLIGPTTVTAGTDAKTDRDIVFPVPAEGRPTQLRITLHLGSYFPTAEWTLPA